MRGAGRRERAAGRGRGVSLLDGLSWWQGLLVLAPLALIFVGGAVGGLLGGLAAVLCARLARRTLNAVLKAVSMACVGALAFGGYFGVVAALRPAPAASQAADAVVQPPSCAHAISAPANSATTSAHPVEFAFRSGNGDDVGRGASVDYAGANVSFSGTARAVRIAAGPWTIELAAPQGESFACGTYSGATEDSSGATPDLSMTGDGAGCGSGDGAFTIYQMAYTKKGVITQMNATFSQKCAASTAPAVGLIRYNATTPTPVPVLPSSAKPITAPAHTGTTSANADEFSVQSASGDFIGGGRPADYTGSSVRVSGNLGSVAVGAAGWVMRLSAQDGEQLTPGTYGDAIRDSSLAEPGISVLDNSRACNTDFGDFTIYQIASDANGALTRLNATFSQRCEWSTAPPLVGFVRFNATTPTPVPTLSASAGAQPAAIATSGTTSANADEFSFQSAPDDSVGLGRSADLNGSGVAVAGDMSSVQVKAGEWTMQLLAPRGKQFAPGTYTASTPESYTGGAADLSVDGGGRGCTSTYGTITIYQIAVDASGGISRLNAIFSQSCGSATAPPLVGFVRFNATTPTPIPVLPSEPTSW